MSRALAIVCGVALIALCACGGGDDDEDSGATYTAQGNWTFDDPTDLLTLEPTASEFPAGCGPGVGSVEQYTVLEVTDTIMTWQDGPEVLVWTRPPGTPDDPVGTWTMVDEEEFYTLTIAGDGTFTVTGQNVFCFD